MKTLAQILGTNCVLALAAVALISFPQLCLGQTPSPVSGGPAPITIEPAPVSPPADGPPSTEPGPISPGGENPSPLGTTTNATWNGNGSSDSWNDTNNWLNQLQPLGGNNSATVNFGGTNRLTPNYDYGDFGSTFNSIFFLSGAGAFTLNGDSPKIFGNIENDSGNLQTINFGSSGAGKWGFVGGNNAADNRFTLNSGDIKVTQSIYLDNGAGINVFGSSFHTLTLANTIFDGNQASGNFTINTNEKVIFQAANSYSGNTLVNAGDLQFDTNGGIKSGNTVFLGSTGSTAAAATVTLISDNKLISNAMNVQSGNTGEAILRSLNSSGTTDNWTGTVTLNKNLTVAAANSGATLNVDRFISGTSGTLRTVNVGSTSTTNNGIVSFGGNADNTDTTAVVNSGTLILNKTSSSSVHAVGATNVTGLTVNNGGTVQLGGTGGDQIYDLTGVVMNGGGRFNTGGNSEGTRPTNGAATNGAAGIGALTLQSTSMASPVTFDFGNSGGAGSSLVFSSISGASGAFVNILNWDGNARTDNGAAGNDRLLFATDPGLTAAQLANFDFSGFAPGAMEIAYGNLFEIVPVPEPSTWLGGGLAFAGLLSFRRRRRLV